MKPLFTLSLEKNSIINDNSSTSNKIIRITVLEFILRMINLLPSFLLINIIVSWINVFGDDFYYDIDPNQLLIFITSFFISPFFYQIIKIEYDK